MTLCVVVDDYCKARRRRKKNEAIFRSCEARRTLAETVDSKFFWLRNCPKFWMSLDQILTKSLGQLRIQKNFESIVSANVLRASQLSQTFGQNLIKLIQN